MTAINHQGGEAVIERCPDCDAGDHHACIGYPECSCPCSDLAEGDA